MRDILQSTASGNASSYTRYIPDRFTVAESADPGIICFGVARSRNDQHARRLLIGQVYRERGYIPFDCSEPFEYIDSYEHNCIPIVAKSRGSVIGSLRMIINTPNNPIPMLSTPGILIHSDWYQRVTGADFEISQLAKSSIAKHDSRPLLGLIRVYLALMQQLTSVTSVAVADNGVKRLLNGRIISGALVEVGPTSRYMGSDSTPVYITPGAVILGARNGQMAQLEEFLSMGEAEKYGWYYGP